jgi:large subunit ribosomal protein L25
VIYGHGSEAVSVSVDGRELRHALSGEAGLNQLLNLRIGPDTHLAMARSLQRHPVRHTLLHLDFLIVGRDEVVVADVPIVLTGEPKALELEKGIVEHLVTLLTVHATPARIPASIEIDISGLTAGEGIRVGDLSLPAGVTTDVSPDEVVVLGSIPRAAIEEEAEAAEAEEAEGAEGAATGAAAEGAQGADGAAQGGATASESGQGREN